MSVRLRGAGLIAGLLWALAPAAAQEGICPGGATVPQATGSVFVVGSGAPAPLQDKARLCPGSILETGAESRATLILEDGAGVFRIDADTRVRVREAADGGGVLEVLRGAIYFLSRVPRVLTIETPLVNAGIEGTEMLVRVGDGAETWTMLQGRAEATTPDGVAVLRDGDRVEVAGTTVTRIPQPADAPPFAGFTGADLDWTLFYPPVLVVDAATDPEILAAAQALDAGRIDGARARLERVADDGRRGAQKRALLAVIDVARNAPDAALARLAEDDAAAVPAVAVARSYALQAEGELAAARDVLRVSTAAGGAENALVWARLAELELAFGARRAALGAADRAAGLADRGETRIVQGFAALLAFDLRSARLAFQAALAREAQNPLAHLGLALAAIRDGDLAAGEQALEVAVALDPNRALTRSYLGKAYAEAFRDGKAGTQLDIAKALDPADPTPWYYDALRKADANRPVEALADLEQAQRLNDNRFVTRSRLLLDSDRAVRAATAARIYRRLGFDQRARHAAGRGVAEDRSDAAGYAFLAESFAGASGLEFARSSAAHRADLSAPPGGGFLDVGAPFTDLQLTARGHALTPGLQEYTRMFERDGIRLGGDLFGGTQSTYGARAAASGLFGPVSVGAATLYSDTEGWRANNDITNTLARGQIKWRLNEVAQISLDGFVRDTSQGFVEFDFDRDPNTITSTPVPPFGTATVATLNDQSRRDIEENALTGALRLTPTPRDEILLAATTGRDSEGLTTVRRLDLPAIPPLLLPAQRSRDETDQTVSSSGEQYEGAWTRRGDGWSFQLGGFLQDATETTRAQTTSTNLDTGDVLTSPATRSETGQDHHAAYAYGDVEPLPGLTVTTGLAFDRLDYAAVDVEAWSPKLGVVWRADPKVTFRAAAFETFSRASLVIDRSLEPPTLAGFPQVFDDGFGSEGQAFAVGVDVRPSPRWVAGASAMARRYDQPLFAGTTIVREDPFREDRVEAYLGFMPSEGWAFTFEPNFAQVFTSTASASGIGGPRTLKTLSAPFALRYFADAGWYAGMGAEFVHQDVERTPDQPSDRQGTENFWLFRAEAGYRLPRNLGLLQLDVENLFGETFRYQDENYRTTETRAPRYIPETQVLLRLSIRLP